VRGHELGHNLGLLHAGGLNAGGQYVEYGDPEAAMGASYRFSSFTAAGRYQMGVLHDAQGEVVEVNPADLPGNSALGALPITLGSLSLPLNQPGADCVAVKISCPSCVPLVSSHSSNMGGYLWLQFRGDEGYSAITNGGIADKYQNKVYVHLARHYQHKRYGAGTEMWAMLTEKKLHPARTVVHCSGLLHRGRSRQSGHSHIRF